MKRTNERTNWTKQKGRTLQFSIWRACKRESVLLSMLYTHTLARAHHNLCGIFVGTSGVYMANGRSCVGCRLNESSEFWVRVFFLSFCFYTFSFFVDVFVFLLTHSFQFRMCLCFERVCYLNSFVCSNALVHAVLSICRYLLFCWRAVISRLIG